MIEPVTHTPGPWRVEGGLPWQPAVRAGGALIAETRNRNDDGANARLIAAAPELLEALRNLLNYSEHSDDTSSLCVEVEDAARAALAKAGAR